MKNLYGTALIFLLGYIIIAATNTQLTWATSISLLLCGYCIMSLVIPSNSSAESAGPSVHPIILGGLLSGTMLIGLGLYVRFEFIPESINSDFVAATPLAMSPGLLFLLGGLMYAIVIAFVVLNRMHEK